MTDSHDDPRWSARLGDLRIITTRLTQLAPGVFPLTAPHLGASDAAIVEAEARLGAPLDAEQAALLRTADGWPDAFLDGTVLGTADLGRGPLWQRAEALLDVAYAGGPSPTWPDRSDLTPIFVSPFQRDVMVIWRGGPVTSGSHPVLWFANDLVDRWPTVHDWWLAAVATAQRTLDDVAGRLGAG